LPVSAELGRTFGRIAEAYDRLRPEFAPEAVDHAIAALRIAPSATVLDLAAGTGKLTRPLRDRFAHVIAVEPDDDMRAFIGGDARAGIAEAIPVEDDGVDAVFVGDAFIWFDLPVALTEIERVLRPGGGLALLGRDWFRREEPPLPDEVTDVLTELYMRIRETRPADGAWRHDLAPEHASFETRFSISGRDLADLELTRSSAAMLDEEERASVAAQIYPRMEPWYELTVVTELDWMRLP
jgi:ubiquinone/menaquinone biosynthesis C-methylase UbiE